MPPRGVVQDLNKLGFSGELKAGTGLQAKTESSQVNGLVIVREIQVESIEAV